MLAGLMGATLLSGIAPAYAQSNPEQRRERGGDRAARAEAGVAVSRGNRMNQPRGDAPPQRWQQRPAERPASPMAPPRPEVRPDNRPQQRPDQWRGDRNQPNRGLETVARDRQQRAQNWRDQQQRQENRPDWRNNRPDDRRDGRDDRRNGRQDGRQDWRNDRRDDRRDTARDWRTDRRDNPRWNDNRGWTGNDRNNWNNGRRFDDRSRWANQRRWDNGWRQDRRYDWNSYRNRYGDRYRMGRYYAPRGWNYGYRSFSVGIFLNSLLYSNSYWLDDPYSYRLPPAYGSLRWIRYYDDALLVDVRDGYVVDVINNFFW